MENDNILYCYTMTHDTGFAPNPYHGVLTLATCKPLIRKYAKVDNWISGWTGNAVHDKQGEIDRKGAGRLVYLAQVSEVLSFQQYWEKYPIKRPLELCNENSISKKGCGCSVKGNIISDHNDCGDNIYKPDEKDPSGFIQLKNRHHGKEQQEHDLSGENVLICKDFYYFGVENAIRIEGVTRIPRWKKLVSKDAHNIIQQIITKYKSGLYPQLL